MSKTQGWIIQRRQYLKRKPWLLGLFTLVVVLAIIGSWLWSVCIRWKFAGAARDGDIVTVRAMLDQGMAPDTMSHIGGIRAISMAAYGGHIEIVRLLLDRGADPTYGLPQAVLMHRTDIVRLLVAHRANIHHWQDYQETPLQFARECGNAEIIQMLKQAGAKE